MKTHLSVQSVPIRLIRGFALWRRTLFWRLFAFLASVHLIKTQLVVAVA